MRNSGKSIWTPRVINNKNGRIMYKNIVCGVAVVITLSCIVALMIGNSMALQVCGILYGLAILAGLIGLFIED